MKCYITLHKHFLCNEVPLLPKLFVFFPEYFFHIPKEDYCNSKTFTIHIVSFFFLRVPWENTVFLLIPTASRVVEYYKLTAVQTRIPGAHPYPPSSSINSASFIPAQSTIVYWVVTDIQLEEICSVINSPPCLSKCSCWADIQRIIWSSQWRFANHLLHLQISGC